MTQNGIFFNPHDRIVHSRDINGALATFVLDKSDGFTQAGVERLSDMIGTYVWAILGVQAQMWSNILKAGTGFVTQKQFLANIEDAVALSVDIPSSIPHYQKTLQYASTPLDSVFGIGLYLSPSNMTLHPGNVQGYNIIVIIAGSDAVIGHNPGINESEQISNTTGDKAFQGKIAPPARTVYRGSQAATTAETVAPFLPPSPQETRRVEQQLQETQRTVESHEEEKTALVTGGIALGLEALWLSSR